MKVTIQ